MNRTISFPGIILLCFIFLITSCRNSVTPPAPVLPVPTDRQLAWHEMEQYAFVHFTTNTFTDKEWGFGDESESVFNPTSMDVNQWTKTIKAAGLKGLVLTCKHHDGFCLWPSQFTEHSVKNSPYKNGKGNVVDEVEKACRAEGLKFGVYLSPWDRNRADYGTPSYVEYYRNQLKELFAAHSPVFEMWFDGANGGDGYYGGANERRKIDGKTYYDWPTTLKLVRGMEPNVIFFSDAGPDIRWCGNESGFIGETNWNTITADSLYAGKSGIEKLLNTGTENGTSWIPAEVDVSIRPGWFYHAKEDSLVKTPEQLFDIYLSSVGRGANLILNIPPDRRGLINEIDVASLQGWKKLIDERFSANLALNKPAKASSVRENSPLYEANMATDGNKETYWATNDQIKTGNLEIDFGERKLISYVLVQEYIKLGQRVKNFTVEIEKDGNWQEVAQGTTIGYKRILRINPVEAQKVRILIADSKACPVISNVEVY
ncbi:MAG: alpha-L-fucosidase [Bacteroidota bacterium]|nr:glycoside hydrolase family 29 [Odoribacter sp.]MDP3644287.1 alpha-L-fucosidase [Bacteroidota bacterium]